MFDREIALALTLVTFHVRAPAFHEFTRATADVRWSSGIFTDLVRAATAQEEAEVKLAYPDLCTELREWVSSDYHTVPATSGRFMRAINVIANMTFSEEQALGSPLESSNEVIDRMLQQYLPPPERPLLRRVERLENAVSTLEEGILAAGVVRLRAAAGVMPGVK